MDLIFKALNFAALAHGGQFRKKTEPGLPYIIHPAAVAVILTGVGADEKTVAAGLLHDVIEDCGVTKNEIEKEFGVEVAKMVDDLTEQDKSLPWAERKRLAREHIKEMGEGSALIKAADTIHNLWSVLNSVERDGLSIFDKFNAPLADQIEMNKKRYAALEARWPENPLLLQLKELVDKLSGLGESPVQPH